MSYLLPHLHSGFAVDQAILSVITKLYCGVFISAPRNMPVNACHEGSCS